MNTLKFTLTLLIGLLIFSTNALFSQISVSTLSGNKAITVNGVPIFLNGIYYNGKRFSPEQRRADLDLFASIGMNMIEACQISDWPNIDTFFEDAKSRNIFLTCEVMFGQNGKGNDFMSKYKSKSALIGWNTADDSHRQFTVDRMKDRNNNIKKLDSNHLTYQTVYKPTISIPYLPLTDMVWSYTYPVHSGKTGSNLINVQNLMDSLTLIYNTCYVGIPQAYNWAAYSTGKPGDRFPEAKEYRNFVYQYIVFGVKGIVPYSFNDAGRLPDVAQDLWEEIKNSCKEINIITPFLLHGTFNRITSGDKSLQISYWKLKNEYLIIIVNISNILSKSVSVDLPVSSNSSLNTIFVKQPSGCNFNNHKITGIVNPLDVHVYKLTVN